MSLTLQTPIIELHRHNVGRLSAYTSGKLAAPLGTYAEKPEPGDTTVEDLLNYFPMRYEDRSNLAGIDELQPGVEASVELYTRTASSYPVRNKRSPKQNLFIYEVTAGDRERRLKPVAVWWFLSGKNAKHIIEYYNDKFARGSRFVAHGEWSWSLKKQTFELKLNKPDELEFLPNDEGSDSFGLLTETPPPVQTDDRSLEEDVADPRLSMVHTARRVPVYRKLGQFQTKRLREIVYDVTRRLDPRTIPEIFPEVMLNEHHLIPRARALAEIHFPPEDSKISDYEMFRSDAHRRLIFEEFFWLSFGLQLKRGERRKEPKGTVIEIPDETRKRIAKLLPFELTKAQERVIDRILEDMRSDAR